MVTLYDFEIALSRFFLDFEGFFYTAESYPLRFHNDKDNEINPLFHEIKNTIAASYIKCCSDMVQGNGYAALTALENVLDDKLTLLLESDECYGKACLNLKDIQVKIDNFTDELRLNIAWVEDWGTIKIPENYHFIGLYYDANGLKKSHSALHSILEQLCNKTDPHQILKELSQFLELYFMSLIRRYDLMPLFFHEICDEAINRHPVESSELTIKNSVNMMCELLIQNMAPEDFDFPPSSPEACDHTAAYVQHRRAKLIELLPKYFSKEHINYLRQLFQKAHANIAYEEDVKLLNENHWTFTQLREAYQRAHSHRLAFSLTQIQTRSHPLFQSLDAKEPQPVEAKTIIPAAAPSQKQ